MFLGWLCSSLAVIPYIDVGLDQELSMPEDSYVTTYFKAMKNYLSVGPPVYFVVKDTNFDYSDHFHQDLIRSGENPSSLTSQLFIASKSSDRTYIAKPASSWLDDYIDWAGIENCCKVKLKTNGTEYCSSAEQSSRYVVSCLTLCFIVFFRCNCLHWSDPSGNASLATFITT